MPGTVMHCFDPGRAEAEGKLIGSLLTGYGELELEMANCLFAATENFDNSVKRIFRLRRAEQRIITADAAMRATYEKADLISVYDETIADMDWCRQIRNQYAHCHWYHTEQDGLCLVNLEEIAKAVPDITTDLAAHKVRIGVPILQLQMDFFVHTRERFWYLGEQCSLYLYRLKNDQPSSLPTPNYQLTASMSRPPLHD